MIGAIALISSYLDTLKDACQSTYTKFVWAT